MDLREFFGVLDDVSGWSCLLLLVWLLVTGRLITARQHAQVVADRDAYRASYDRLREAEVARGAAADRQLLESVAALRKLVEALPGP